MWSPMSIKTHTEKIILENKSSWVQKGISVAAESSLTFKHAFLKKPPTGERTFSNVEFPNKLTGHKQWPAGYGGTHL